MKHYSVIFSLLTTSLILITALDISSSQRNTSSPEVYLDTHLFLLSGCDTTGLRQRQKPVVAALSENVPFQIPPARTKRRDPYNAIARLICAEIIHTSCVILADYFPSIKTIANRHSTEIAATALHSTLLEKNKLKITSQKVAKVAIREAIILCAFHAGDYIGFNQALSQTYKTSSASKWLTKQSKTRQKQVEFCAGFVRAGGRLFIDHLLDKACSYLTNQRA